MRLHEVSSANVAVKRGAPESAQPSAVKRLQTSSNVIAIEDDDGHHSVGNAVRYASPRPPWPPRDMPHVDNSQETATLQAKQPKLQNSVKTLQEFSTLNIREKKNAGAYIGELEQKIRGLETEVSDLTNEIRERERLYSEAFQQQQQQQQHKPERADPQAQINQLLKENKKLKKSAKSENRTLIAERDDLHEQLAHANKTAIANETQLNEAREQYNELIAQKRKVEQEFKTRGEEIIKLTRDLNTLTQRESTSESRRTLLAQLGSMFAHYRTLYERNEALVGKLMNMAKAGGFGHHSSLYRREVESMKGMQLEGLEEYKWHVK